MVGVVEDDDGLPPRGAAGDLDRVLHGLRARVEQDRPLLVVARRHPVQGLAHVHVGLVRVDHEAGVREAAHLLCGPLHDAGVGVADVGHRDAGAEVDEGVAVDVLDDAAAGALDVDRQDTAHALGDGGRAALLDRAALRAGDLRDDPTGLDDLGRGHAAASFWAGSG